MKIRIPVEADSIEIIDSIPEHESQTALHLWNDLQDLQYDPVTSQCKVNRHSVASAAELHEVLTNLADHSEKHDLRPVLHLESHGSKEGLTLSNGDFVPWSDLQPAFFRLNKATRNHLFIVVAACWGFYAIKAMVSQIFRFMMQLRFAYFWDQPKRQRAGLWKTR